MNKFWKFSGIIAVLVAVVAFAGATAVFAQGPNQPDDYTPQGGNQMHGDSSQGMGMMAVEEADIHAAIAGVLGMSVEEFETAVAGGSTPLILAQEKGIDFAVVQEAMNAVHAEAMQQAVDDGLTTQEQADWVLSHRGGQSDQGSNMNGGQSGSPSGNMGRGHGSSGSTNNGDCTYQTP